MSTWVTPAGSIGTYTQQRQFTYTFQASTSLGGRIVYQLVGSWPPGTYNLKTFEPTSGVFVGILTATPAFVPVPTTYDFTISATEVTGMGSSPNNRAFSLTVGTTEWVTPNSLGGYVELSALSIQLEATPSVPGNTITYTLLNGNLPASNNINAPITLSGSGLISGTLGQVSEITTSTFTVRALEYNTALTPELVSFRDRTFEISVSGTTAPTFITAAGSTILNILDSKWVDYQVLYSNPDPGTAVLITLASGNLPPGLEIRPSGIIQGYAQPPVNSSGAPTTETYTFTLKIQSQSGENLSQYNIVVQNQETVPGFVGREPTILNTQPLTVLIPPTDPYAAYYNDGNLGEITSDNYFVFKFIGYDFDDDDIGYSLLPADVFSNIGLTFDSQTGWVTGTITQTVLPSVNSYNFILYTYKLSDPSIRSENFKFSITIVNNIDTRVVWETQADLGSINNGDTSVFAVRATSLAGKNLLYRIAGNEFTADVFNIVRTSDQFLGFGPLGAYAQSDLDGTSWSLNTSTLLSQQQFNIYGSVYDIYTSPPTVIAVGNDPSGRAVFTKSSDGLNWFYNYAPGLPEKLNSVAFNDSGISPIYVAVGTDGYSMRSTDGINWTQSTTGVTDTLNDILWDGSRFVAVGDRGTVIYSTNGTSWSSTSNTIENNLNGIVYTGTVWLMVGDLGVIVRASDITDSGTWTVSSVFTNYDYKKIAYGSSSLVVVGTSGSILTSINDGVNWTTQNAKTYADFYDVLYDSIQTNAFWVSGQAGAIYTSDNLINWESPTVTTLPENLVFQTNGDITGRLAFQTKSSVTPVGTTTVYNFTVQAYCVDLGFEQITSTKQFSLQTYQKFALPYDNLYIKALVEPADRDYVLGILEDPVIVPPQNIYRPDDPYFGRARSIVYQHMFGVPSIAAADFYSTYIDAVTKNHYWRNITLGPVKVSQARNRQNEVIYEAVYSEVIDNLVNNMGISISKQINWPRPIRLDDAPYFDSTTVLNDSMTYYDPQPQVKYVLSNTGTSIQLNNVSGLSVGMNVTGDSITFNTLNRPPVIVSINSSTNTVTLNISQSILTGSQLVFSAPAMTSNSNEYVQVLYPNSLYNMREQIADTVGFINDSSLLPLWMSSQQSNGSTLGYTQAWVMCYALPGTGQAIADAINQYMADNDRYINTIDFKIDRFEVDRSLTYGFEGGTAANPIWATLPSDGVIGDSENSYIYFPHKTVLPR
jgi:hypothetical protein